MASWAERHVVNRLVRVGVRLGREIDGVRELEVAGRRTGRRGRVPVKVLEVGGARYLVSLTGDSGWARNLRAAGTAQPRFGRRVEAITATELADADKAPVARAYLESAERAATRARLGWAAEGLPDAEALRGAAAVPVFRIEPLHLDAPRGQTP